MTMPNRSESVISDDFRLERHPSEFLKGHRSYRALLSANMVACCSSCCCCLDLLGAYAGTYLGSIVGTGIGYRELMKHHNNIPRYRWVVLTSVILNVVVHACVAGIIACLPGPVPGILVVLILVVLIPCVTLGTPCLGYWYAKRFSGKLLALSISLSVLGAVLGFCIGAAIMGGSVLI